MAHELEHLEVRTQGRVLIVTISRPDVRNTLAPQTWVELKQVALEAARDASVAVVVVTGAGDKAFASGADIRALRERTVLEGLSASATAQDTLNALEGLAKPVIAAVNGAALGAGCELALACDIRIASEAARFGQPETGLGVVPGAGGTQRLVRLVGLGKAKELVLTGSIIDAHEAQRIGLVNAVVQTGDLLPTAVAMADRIASRAPIAVRLAKAALNLSGDVDVRSGLAFEQLAHAILLGTDDKVEGTSAFLEKRTPDFKGR